MIPSELSKILRGYDIAFHSEDELQHAIQKILVLEQLKFSREVRITEHDRIDFLVEALGVEIKIAGSLSEVTRQVHRYMQSNDLAALLLVTTKARHLNLPSTINGKEIEVYFIGGL